MTYLKSSLAFTIIELLITMAVMAILINIAYVSYTSYQIRQNRELARHLLLINSNILEAHHLLYGSYAKSNSWPKLLKQVHNLHGELVYILSFYPPTPASTNQQTYCLIATPVANSIQMDDKKIYITEQGIPTASPPTNCYFS